MRTGGRGTLLALAGWWAGRGGAGAVAAVLGSDGESELGVVATPPPVFPPYPGG
jgi:hypothetical protein